MLLLALQENAIALMLPPLQHVGDRFCLDNLDEEACLGRFRFRKAHLSELHDALGACPGTSRLLAERPGQALKACWSSYDGWLTQVASAICARNSAGQSQS